MILLVTILPVDCTVFRVYSTLFSPDLGLAAAPNLRMVDTLEAARQCTCMEDTPIFRDLEDPQAMIVDLEPLTTAATYVCAKDLYAFQDVVVSNSRTIL
jgi:hypothetical protein